MMFMLISTHHDSTYMYTKHKISMTRVLKLEYFLEDCVLACWLFSYFVNATITKTVNFDERFEYYKYFSKVMNLNE